jgi:excisionase family DNA binding protein
MTTKGSELPRLLTVAEIAGVLNVRRGWVYERVSSNRIPHVKVGRYPRFKLADILEWVEDSSGH